MEKIMWFWDKWKKVEKTFNEIAIKVQKREKLSLEQNQALIDAINIVIKKQALTSKDKDAEFAIGVGHLKAAQIKMNTSSNEEFDEILEARQRFERTFENFSNDLEYTKSENDNPQYELDNIYNIAVIKTFIGICNLILNEYENGLKDFKMSITYAQQSSKELWKAYNRDEELNKHVGGVYLKANIRNGFNYNHTNDKLTQKDINDLSNILAMKLWNMYRNTITGSPYYHEVINQYSVDRGVKLEKLISNFVNRIENN